MTRLTNALLADGRQVDIGISDGRILERREARVSNHAAYLVTSSGSYETLDGKAYMTIMTATLPRPGHLYIVACGAGGQTASEEAAAWEAWRPIITHIMGTFRIEGRGQ